MIARRKTCLATTALAPLATVAWLMLAPCLSVAASIGPIVQSYEKLGQARGRMEIVRTDEQGHEARSITEFDTFDRVHVRQGNSEIIALPEGTWVRSGDGKWAKRDVDILGPFKRGMSAAEKALYSSTNLVDVGATTWQGKTAHAWSYDLDMTLGNLRSITRNKVYLDAAGRARGFEIDGVMEGHKFRSVQTFTYDDSVRVNAPN